MISEKTKQKDSTLGYYDDHADEFLHGGCVTVMKIATWNVERLKHYKDIAVIKREIEKCDADIEVS